MIDSMPARCSRCESINPAGPAPTMPTCVRNVGLRCNQRPSIGGHPHKGKGRSQETLARLSKAERRPAVTAHALAIDAISVAELRFKITLLALDHAEMQRH